MSMIHHPTKRDQMGEHLEPTGGTPASKPPQSPAPEAAAKPVPQTKTITLYESRKKIYARSVKGWFNNWRWAMVAFTQILYYGLPWLTWNDRPAVLFDLVQRKFYLFGVVLWPQDFIYLTALLVVSALGLFLFTAIGGRLFCGYACPQTVYTEIFMAIERFTEGDRAVRMRRDQGPWNADRIRRRASTLALWTLVALWTGFTFAGYFTPIKDLGGLTLAGDLGPWQAFWILFYAGFTMLQAGFMREQVCKYMCPYARFQSAMFDKDTLVVTYDAVRGDPRGSRSKKIKHREQGLGDCIDCGVCVQVCPTGIDIRKGLQYECIGCGACADGCDEIMDKMGYTRGLIRYATQNGLEKQWSRKQMIDQLLRPRVVVYTTILAVIAITVFVSLGMRVPLKVDVLRDRGVLAREVEDGNIENAYRIQLINTDEKPHIIHVIPSGLHGVKVAGQDRFELAPTQTAMFPIRLQSHRDDLEGKKSGSHPVVLTLIAEDDDKIEVEEKTTFFIPR